tara:strand:- start:1460 stop:1687 length:228 start_codon:yes stop_codon:yes gene_type:complete
MKKKYILAMDYDEEDIEHDTFYTSTNYMEFDSEQDAFIYLNKNIYYNDSDKQKPNFASVAKYCEEFKFRFYERRI